MSEFSKKLQGLEKDYVMKRAAEIFDDLERTVREIPPETPIPLSFESLPDPSAMIAPPVVTNHGAIPNNNSNMRVTGNLFVKF